MLYVIVPIWLGFSKKGTYELHWSNLLGRLKPAAAKEELVQPHRCHQASKRGQLSSQVFFFLQLRHLLCSSFPSCKDKLMWLWSPWTEPDSSFFHSKSWMYSSSPRWVCWPSSLLMKGESCVPLLPSPKVSLWICTSVGANSISITNWFSSLKHKKTNLTKKHGFLLG